MSTPKEVAVFWYNSSIKLTDDLIQSEIAIKNLTIEVNDLKNKLEVAQKEIKYWKEKSNSYPNSMTYEQMIDLKCEIARLGEENAKFAKWRRILDKFKIF